jgi:hypothetical protein
MTLIPKRGGTYPIYGVFLGGGSVGAGWDMDDARYRLSSQRRDKKSVRKVERGLTDTQDKTTTLKFNSTLELDGKVLNSRSPNCSRAHAHRQVRAL